MDTQWARCWEEALVDTLRHTPKMVKTWTWFHCVCTCVRVCVCVCVSGLAFTVCVCVTFPEKRLGKYVCGCLDL